LNHFTVPRATWNSLMPGPKTLFFTAHSRGGDGRSL
jgi:hypothetical protein